MHDSPNLLADLRRRDPVAFSRLFEACSDRIFRLAVGLLENEDEAEDVVQDTFMRLFEHLEQFEGRANLSTWLYRVAYNASIDRLRKRRPTLPIGVEADEDERVPVPGVLIDWGRVPEACLASAELSAELDKAIASLPDKLRATFILREIEGLSTEQSAKVLDISMNTSKVRLHRARLLLRERLAEYFSELA